MKGKLGDGLRICSRSGLQHGYALSCTADRVVLGNIIDDAHRQRQFPRLRGHVAGFAKKYESASRVILRFPRVVAQFRGDGKPIRCLLFRKIILEQ